jgi:hypothetical protein
MDESMKKIIGEKMKSWKILPLIILLFGCESVTSIVSTSATARTKRIPEDAADTPAPMKFTSGPFTLTIFSPADEAVVNEPQVTLLGEVSSDAVVTINESTNIIYAGRFSETVPLEEGINTIQIVASDMDGNEVDVVLTVSYQP